MLFYVLVAILFKFVAGLFLKVSFLTAFLSYPLRFKVFACLPIFVSNCMCSLSFFMTEIQRKIQLFKPWSRYFCVLLLLFGPFRKLFFRICLYALFCNCFLPADLYVKIQRKQLCCGCWPATVNESKYCSLLILWREISPASRQSSTTRIAAPWEIYGIRSGLLDISDSHSCFRFPLRSWYFWSS